MGVHVSPPNRMSHKFHVGQLVEFRPKKGSPISAARGAYEILKQLPVRDGELQYRIKSAAEQHDRVAGESELIPLLSQSISVSETNRTQPIFQILALGQAPQWLFFGIQNRGI
jgi:hypothetical protein